MREVVVLVLGLCTVSAHDLITTKITWSREISRIFVERCLSCHREGGAAPFPFETYEQTRPWAKAIKEEVLQRRMPPWGAVKGFGDLHPDPSLTQEEVNRIAEWVEGGAPEGDATLMPAMRPATSKWVTHSHSTIAVKNGFVSSKKLVLLGLRPTADVIRARLFAVKPDGSTEPLLWLRDYKAAWKRSFWLRTPMTLPEGTTIRIEGEAPVQLLVATGAPRRAR